MVSTGMCHAEYTFDGHKLCDIWDISKNAPCITHGVMKTAEGGAFFFCWEAKDKESEALVRSFDALKNSDKADIFAQYCFLQSENTFFSKEWWDGLAPKAQFYIKKLSRAFYYEGGVYEPSGFTLLNCVISGAKYN